MNGVKAKQSHCDHKVAATPTSAFRREEKPGKLKSQKSTRHCEDLKFKGESNIFWGILSVTSIKAFMEVTDKIPQKNIHILSVK